MSESPFLNPDPERVFYRSKLVLGIWDAFPVSPGHALLVPTRLVPTWFEATAEEQQALINAVNVAKHAIESEHGTPDGYNIGINVGEAAGQTVFHLHVHVIPRFKGDVADPRGGVRHVIPARANYLADDKRETPDPRSQVQEAPAQDWALSTGKLVRGLDDPLMPHLLQDLDAAGQADIAVAFILQSGVDILEPHLLDLLEQRNGKLRLVTGDYLDATDPDALQRLLDLPGQVHLRLFRTAQSKVSFHPKSYLFTTTQNRSTAYVGSSNLSRSAICTGVEWNYRISPGSQSELLQVRQAFEALFHHPDTVPLNETTLAQYRRRRRPPTHTLDRTVPEVEPAREIPTPHGIQVEALAALEQTRKAGNRAGLVVLATGLGKTWLSAFDSAGFNRVLFVAHREEILGQAMRTYRQIRPHATFGFYTGQEKAPTADVLFASVQTLGKASHHRQFAREHFDYIVIDEFHHAAAATYRRLIDYFEPRFLLGLTATPERTDGGDLLGLCGENLVYRCDLADGIRRELLCPFRYYGVPDEVDYSNIPWRSSRFDPEALTNAVATQSRAENALEQYKKHGGKRTVAFCCSQTHADFMASYFQENGLRAVSVHSGPESAPRSGSLEKLGQGELDIICSVDMFNEGLDLPQIDTVMMLRPTESRVLWLQQFGRGLRKAEGKQSLAVIDYIGNHRTFLIKPQTLLLEMIGGSKLSDVELAQALKALEKGEIELPPGCEITYDLQAVDILSQLIRKPKKDEALRIYYEDHRALHGRRPTALEAYHEGYAPRSARQTFGSWLGFVRVMGDLEAAEETAFTANQDFLEGLETTPMSKSYKMLVLAAMLNEDCFPGEISLSELTRAVARLAGRSANLRADISEEIEDLDKLGRLLERNPIDAWCGGKGTRKKAFFQYEDGVFRSVGFETSERKALQGLVREIVDWRLGEYLERETTLSSGFECKVSHAGDKPILFLPDRDKVPGIPTGATRVIADGKEYEAKFVKVAVNVMTQAGSNNNVLPSVLRGWFGADAGRPGTRHRVRFEVGDDGLEMVPVGRVTGEATLWKRYSREQIPGLFGLEFNTGLWNQGFVFKDDHIVLLVTLDKGDLLEGHQYSDLFLAEDLFQWESQTRTRQDDLHGLTIREHKERGIHVHLFVRKTKKVSGQVAPFVNCGEVDFVDWEGEQPITVRWRLQTPLPERIQQEFRVEG